MQLVIDYSMILKRVKLIQSHVSRYFSAKVPCKESKEARIFSGIQPTGQIHLGNYFGAIRQWVTYQNDSKYSKTIYSVVDLHAVTIPQNPDNLEKSILGSTATLLACGIKPEKSILFLQSHIEEHCQLQWILSSLTSMLRLGQLHQYKEKSKTLKDVPVGLFTYPVLQTADILLYNATEIPIGEDNLQHIELAQHLAKAFNRHYGHTFEIPKPLIEDGMTKRLRSLRKPGNKMSKSEPDSKSRIHLIDSPDVIRSKIKSAVTDSTSAVSYDPETRLGVSNLIEIHALSTGESRENIVKNSVHLDTGRYKQVVAEALIEYLKPIRNSLLQLQDDPHYLVQTLLQGRERAKEIVQPIWEDVCYKVGIAPRLNLYLKNSQRPKRAEWISK